MSYYAHAFTGRLVIHRLGHYRYRAVFLPPALAAGLPFRGRTPLRISGEVADVPIEGAWQPAGEAAGGGHYLMVSPAICRAAGLAIGDAVEVRFNVADRTAIAVPDELARALAADAAARATWEALTPGKRRAIAVQVDAARTAPTRERRVATFVAALAAGRDPTARPRGTRTSGVTPSATAPAAPPRRGRATTPRAAG